VTKYKKKCKIKKGYMPDFLSTYYSPILTVLKQYFKNLKGKSILEAGYRIPIFLDYLRLKGVDTYGIDIGPYITDRNLLRMPVEKISDKFKKKYSNYFHAIIERLTLSRLYDEEYFLKTGKRRFKNKKLILSNLYKLLRPNGILVLQDDRGSIFTETEFKKAKFKKILKEIPITFKKGWNTLVVYKK